MPLLPAVCPSHSVFHTACSMCGLLTPCLRFVVACGGTARRAQRAARQSARELAAQSKQPEHVAIELLKDQTVFLLEVRCTHLGQQFPDAIQALVQLKAQLVAFTKELITPAKSGDEVVRVASEVLQTAEAGVARLACRTCGGFELMRIRGAVPGRLGWAGGTRARGGGVWGRQCGATPAHIPLTATTTAMQRAQSLCDEQAAMPLAFACSPRNAAPCANCARCLRRLPYAGDAGDATGSSGQSAEAGGCQRHYNSGGGGESGSAVHQRMVGWASQPHMSRPAALHALGECRSDGAVPHIDIAPLTVAERHRLL